MLTDISKLPKYKRTTFMDFRDEEYPNRATYVKKLHEKLLTTENNEEFNRPGESSEERSLRDRYGFSKDSWEVKARRGNAIT